MYTLVVQAMGLWEFERKSGLMATACSSYQTFTFDTRDAALSATSNYGFFFFLLTHLY